MSKIHNLSKTRIYQRWKAIKSRCYCQNNKSYQYYGARGITVCDEWLDKNNGFINFYVWSMANNYDDSLSLDRIDNAKGYSPDNCRWVTLKRQQRNKQKTIKLSHNGETKSLADWCESFDFPYSVAIGRYLTMKENGNIIFENIFASFKPRPRSKTKQCQNVCSKRNLMYRPIYQYDKRGNLLKIWSDLREIKSTGLYNKNAILNCCYGLAETHKGYVWKYVNDPYIKNPKSVSYLKRNPKGRSPKSVIKYNLDWSVSKIYNSVSETRKYEHMKSETIQKYCYSDLPYNGYYWRYKDE